MLAHYASQEKIQDQANQISKILENEFKIVARRTGDIEDVIDETALEVRTSLGNSLAAAKADRWQEAESHVLEATYNYSISPWWTIQPDFQYIWTPSAENGSQDAAVFGIRSVISF
jgi:Carbohydrate-selective porin, OprB family